MIKVQAKSQYANYERYFEDSSASEAADVYQDLKDDGWIVQWLSFPGISMANHLRELGGELLLQVEDLLNPASGGVQ